MTQNKQPAARNEEASLAINRMPCEALAVVSLFIRRTTTLRDGVKTCALDQTYRASAACMSRLDLYRSRQMLPLAKW